jgi:type I restriction enzyme R subunit
MSFAACDAYAVKPDTVKVDLATVLEDNVKDQITIVDWVNREDVQKEMRKRLKRLLRLTNRGDEEAVTLAELVVDLLKRRNGRQ